MGGVWERMIGVTRRMLSTTTSKLTHEVLTIFMAEVSAIVNSRPIVPVSTDPENPTVLSPSMILTQKSDVVDTHSSIGDFELKDIYRAQWRHVQHLADQFWKRWKVEFLQQLQSRRKWTVKKRNLQIGDVVLLKDKTVHRNDWPLGRVVNAIPSNDGNVRKAEVRVFKDNKFSTYTRPICEMVLLVSEH
ncbi:uncharacterized protein LOC117318933 [Pecten maximus]|uniref:uncharacterized protein LOC117318933 n=1 Tax=Pecten maximus TaxID=6579 RepID=UPI00145875FD|nr:uncharacterized protein LOC117318933 [Pecten maximus]